MKKKFAGLISALLLGISFCMPVFAWDSMPLVVDNADILSDSEESSLLSTLEGISNANQMDIVVVTVDGMDGKSAQDYADDFYDYNGYAEDGILLLVDMDSRKWHVSTKGFGITAVTDAGLEYMSEKFLDALSDGRYYDSFMTYTELCDDFIIQAKAGNPYDVGNMPKAPFGAPKKLLISLVVGLVVSFIVTQGMKGQLKTVHMQQRATQYVKKDSMRVTQSREMYLYSHIDRTAKPKENSSGGSSVHTSSSGSSHGGGGGSF